MHRPVVPGSASDAKSPILGGLVFALLALWLCLGPKVAAAQPGASLEALNRALEALGREQTRSERVGEALDQLIEVATQRQALLAALVEQDPGQVLALAVPADVRQRLPAAVQAKLERHVELEAEVTALYEHDPERAVLRHFLRANGRWRSLHFAEDPPDLRTGDRVRVRGVEVPLPGDTVSGAVVAYCCGVDGALALAGGNGNGKGGRGDDGGGVVPELPSTTGEHRVLTILVNFEDDPSEPYSPAQARAVVFGTTHDFIVENSYQQTWLAGDVAGWYTMPLSSTECDLFAIASHARSAASAGGFDLAAYQHHVYAFPRGTCTGIGVGTVGGDPSQAWIIEDLDLKVLSHEFGHNLGLHHARALDCGTSVLGSDCTVFEYGDRIDTMGNVAAGHYNAFHKDLLGWFDTGTAPVVTEVQADGVYLLEPLEAPGPGPRALAIPKSVDPATGEETWYYLEFRRPIGFDGFLAANENVLNGIIVHTGSLSNANSSDQLDMTPGSGLQNWSDWSDAALEVGESFHDPDAGVTITPLSVGPAAAEVSVTLGAPVPEPEGTASGLEVAAACDRALYGWKDTAEISSVVTADGAPVSDADVSFLITDPTGVTAVRSATTGPDGAAAVRVRFRRRDPLGRYEVRADVRAGGDARTSFVLE